MLQKSSMRELWDLQTGYLKEGKPVKLIGEEMMRRTDTSAVRKRQSDRECAQRRDVLAKATPS